MNNGLTVKLTQFSESTMVHISAELPDAQAKQLAEIVTGFIARPFVCPAVEGAPGEFTITGIRYVPPQEGASDGS